VPNKLEGNLIKTGKDKIDTCKLTDVVYKIQCDDCEKSYVGQTKRFIRKRIDEHKNNISTPGAELSVISEHTYN
ncbi:hypothetical protein L9F63_026624, partial [Diploptera punctata]